MQRKLLSTAVLIFSVGAAVSAQHLRDTVKIRELSKTIKEKRYWTTHPDSMLLLAGQGLSLAESIDDKYGMADMHKFLGIYAWSQGDYRLSIEHYSKAKELYDGLGRSFASAQILSNLGMVYSRLSNTEKALSHYQQALLIMQNHPEADLASLAGTTSSMGLVFRNHGDLDAAQQMFHKSINYYLQLSDSLNLAGTLTNLATVYSRKKLYDSAVYFNEKAAGIFKRLNNTRGLLIAYNNLGTVAMAGNDYETAIKFFSEAQALNSDGLFFESQVATLTGLGEAHTELRRYQEAEKYFRDAAHIAGKKNRSKLIEIYRGLAECYKRTEKPALALEYFEKFASLRDSIYNAESAALISNLRVSYDVDQKNAAIALLEKDNKIALLVRNIIIAAAAMGTVLSGFVIYGLQRKRRRDKSVLQLEIQSHEARHVRTEAELENQRMREEELKKELEFRSRALTTYTLNLIQKNGMLDEVRGVIQDVLKEKGEKDAELKKLIRLIDYSFTLDKEWEGFKTYFEQVHPDFFRKLKENYPQLSATELKLCALIRLSLSIKESATVLSISPDSVKVSRHRVRKKLGLTTDNNLTEFIMAV